MWILCLETFGWLCVLNVIINDKCKTEKRLIEYLSSNNIYFINSIMFKWKHEVIVDKKNSTYTWETILGKQLEIQYVHCEYAGNVFAKKWTCAVVHFARKQFRCYQHPSINNNVNWIHNDHQAITVKSLKTCFINSLIKMAVF